MKKTFEGKLLDSITTEARVEDLTTKALRQLEARDYAGAVKIIDEALQDAEYIEQRMALVSARAVATDANEFITKTYFNTIYDI